MKLKVIHHIDKHEHGTWVRGNYHVKLGWIGYVTRSYAGGWATFIIK